MPRLIAIEWDASEARVVAARHRGPEVVLEQAFTVDLRPRGAEPPGEPRVGEKLAAALSARSVGRGEVLVAVGRASIELRPLTLPPAPDEELPDLVRFQALRQFSNLGEDWPLDFTLLDSQGESRSVLAAAISPDLVEQIQLHCAQADLKPKRLVLRPFAAASLLVRRQPQATGCRLMVDWLADEVDLTVLIGSQVVFLRTVRLPAVEDTQQQAQALIREIRRTMAAAQNQLGGVGVDRIVLCGQEEAGSDDSDASSTAERHRRHEVKGQIEDALSLPVEWLNPLDGFELGHELLKHRPRRPGRFAPLCGMVLDEAAGSPHSIDFLHPRKAPSAAGPKQRPVAIWAGIAAAALIAVGGTTYARLVQLDSEIADLKKRSSELDKPVKAARELQKKVATIEEFTTSEVSWIDEMRHLSESLPPAEHVMLSRFEASVSPKPRITLDGNARAAADVNVLETKLRDARHEVTSKGVREDPKRKSYRWGFSETIEIKPNEKLVTKFRRSSEAKAPAVTSPAAMPATATRQTVSPAAKAPAARTGRPAKTSETMTVKKKAAGAGE